MFKKYLLALCVSVVSLSACAAPDGTAPQGPEAVVRKAVHTFAPRVVIDSVRPAPFPGFYQVIGSGQSVYVSSDGKYMMDGDLIDLASRRNVSDDGWAALRKAELAKIPASDRIVFAPANPRYRVTVFTDVNCAYCRKLHEHIADYNKAGIAVEYVAWPREGVVDESGQTTATYNEMVSVWCSADRKAAFTAAKMGKPPKATNCPNPVKEEFELGVRLGVNGTPAIVAEDGTMIAGFLTPSQLVERLSKGTPAGG